MNQRNGFSQSSTAAHLKILLLSVESFLNAKNGDKISALNNLIVVYDSINDSLVEEEKDKDYASYRI